MKKIIITIIISILFTVSLLFIFMEVKAQRDQLRGGVIEEIDSKILKESRTLLVHLPKDYDLNTAKNHPILIAFYSIPNALRIWNHRH